MAMFSRFKKDDDGTGRSMPMAKPAPSAAPQSTAKPAAAPAPRVQPVVAPKPAAQAVAQDKEKKRRDRLGEIKVELHKRLLENLNLAALETATEANLRAEIGAIAGEALDEMSIVLNKEDRQTVNQELYDEVMGLGPLEPLLKDELGQRYSGERAEPDLRRTRRQAGTDRNHLQG